MVPSFVPREQNQTNLAFGGGGWVLEGARPAPDPPPLTTIAWRLCHLAIFMHARADYTIGTKALAWDQFTIPETAAAGRATLMKAGAFWREALTSADDDALDQVGRSSFPRGLDPTLPFLDISWWVNQELLHRGGEIALLRDLFRATPR